MPIKQEEKMVLIAWKTLMLKYCQTFSFRKTEWIYLQGDNLCISFTLKNQSLWKEITTRKQADPLAKFMKWKLELLYNEEIQVTFQEQ